MSKELDRLERAFGSEKSLAPQSDTKNAAIDFAMQQFEQENKIQENIHGRQGISSGARLNEQGNTMLNLVNWRRKMEMINLNMKHLLAGGVSLAVLTLAVVNINQIDLPPIELGLDVGTETTSVDVVDAKPLEQNETDIDGTIALEERADDRTGKLAQPKLEKKDFADIAAGERGRLESKIAPATPVVKPFLPRKVTGLKQDGLAGLIAPSSGNSQFLRSKGLGAAKRRQGFANAPQSSMPRPAPAGNTAHIKRLLRPGSEAVAPGYQDVGRDKFSEITPNAIKLASENPVSTFSVDVDTASYSFMRGSLNRGVLPQKNAVRIEELINYFDYNYALPQTRDAPFKINAAIMPTPWNKATKLMRIGIKGFSLPAGATPKSNLVFLIDTSGSMNAPDKLPLLRNSFKLLLSSLKPDDTVAIVTYAGSAGTVLEPTKVADKNKILAALDRLSSGGSTAGAAGIRQAYQLAERNMNKDGVNRVILATDGDFNVGISNPEELKGYVERKRATGVTLSVLGFGRGNYNDELMQKLAQNGNGNAAYIDTLSEARKVLVEQAGGTLFTIAKDVKIQIEFNPSAVNDYRLIGYETRQLKREDFNNDKIDAGDIGAGHSVTAIYELTPKGAKGKVDALRYGNDSAGKTKPAKPARVVDASDEMAFVKIRYKLPNGDISKLISVPVATANETSTVDDAPQNMRFAAAVAAYGQILRGGRHTGKYSYDDVINLALSARGEDRFGYRSEFINLVRLAKTAAAQ